MLAAVPVSMPQDASLMRCSGMLPVSLLMSAVMALLLIILL